MKTIVTGGTGFIGSHLVKNLLKQGREVIVVSAHLPIKNLTDFGLRTSDFGLRKADLSDFNQALKAMKGAEVIFHLAARVGSLEYLHGSELAELVALQTNLVIDANVFRACIINKVKKLVYASSVAVYPMDKQYSPNAVFSENDLELKCLFACTQGTQPTIMTSDLGHRTSDIGPRTLDFGLRTLTVNIGSGEAVSIGTIAQKVVELSGKNIEIKYDPGKPVGPVSRTADITRARALLDWQPEVSLDEGLRRTYAWAAKRLEQR